MTKKQEKQPQDEKAEDKKPKIKAYFAREMVTADNKDSAKELYDQSRLGEIVEIGEEGKIQYSLVEGLYLLEKKRMDVYDSKDKKMKFDDFVKKSRKLEPNFWIRYVVFRDMRNRGYVVKTALKFGADFRIYDRGIKPGEDHAKWILYPVHEGETLTWYEFAAKNRVAHSTRKKLLLGIVDDESDITYYTISWTRP